MRLGRSLTNDKHGLDRWLSCAGRTLTHIELWRYKCNLVAIRDGLLLCLRHQLPQLSL